MHIAVEITGVSPLLVNRFHEAAQEAVQNGTSQVVKARKGAPRDQCVVKLYTSPDGKPIIPGPNVFAAIIEAGKFLKAGKSKVTTTRSSLVPAGISLLELELPLMPGKWEPDSRAVVIPATQGRQMCHRPRFDEWRAKFTLQIDTDMFNADTVRELVDLAGSRVGVGDFRPSRKGPFGRFKVTTWKVSK